MRFRSFFFVALLLTGCAVDPSPAQVGPQRVTPDREFTLQIGESAFIEDSSHAVIFDAVLEDSRCAQGVTCVWEGNARLQFILREFSPMGAGAVEVLDSGIELNTSEKYARQYEFSKYVIELRQLEPLPVAGAPTSGYIATLLIRPRS
jgi:hypothetical protein